MRESLDWKYKYGVLKFKMYVFVWASSRPLNKGCIKGRRKKKVVILAERPAKGQPPATAGLNGVFSQKEIGRASVGKECQY